MVYVLESEPAMPIQLATMGFVPANHLIDGLVANGCFAQGPAPARYLLWGPVLLKASNDGSTHLGSQFAGFLTTALEGIGRALGKPRAVLPRILGGITINFTVNRTGMNADAGSNRFWGESFLE